MSKRPYQSSHKVCPGIPFGRQGVGAIFERVYRNTESRKLVNKVKTEIKEMAGVLEFFRELKKESLRVRHWVQILNYIKRPQLINA